MKKLSPYKTFGGQRYKQYGICFSERDKSETMARVNAGGKYTTRSVKGPRGKYAMWTIYVRKK